MGIEFTRTLIRTKELLTRNRVTSITFVPDIRRALFTPLKKKTFVPLLLECHTIFYERLIHDSTRVDSVSSSGYKSIEHMCTSCNHNNYCLWYYCMTNFAIELVFVHNNILNSVLLCLVQFKNNPEVFFYLPSINMKLSCRKQGHFDPFNLTFAHGTDL